MRQGYITHYEIWVDGKCLAWGNQSLSVDSPYPTDADQFFRAITEKIAEQGNCSTKNVRILGVFKL